MTFEQWMEKVDEFLGSVCGLSHNDLADQTWRDWFDSEMSPAEAGAECLANEGYDELLDE